MSRANGRKNDEIREVTIEMDVNAYAEGSCLIKFGNTHVLCTATVDESIPRFLKGSGKGWGYSRIWNATKIYS